MNDQGVFDTLKIFGSLWLIVLSSSLVGLYMWDTWLSPDQVIALNLGNTYPAEIESGVSRKESAFSVGI